MGGIANDGLPTGNSSSLVIEIPTSLLREWIESLTKDTVLGRFAWSWDKESIPEIQFGNGLFSIGPCGSGMPRDFWIEIRVIVRERPSSTHAGDTYRSTCGFWKKIIKSGDVLYEECRELWNLLLLLRNGRLSANHMRVAAAAHNAIIKEAKTMQVSPISQELLEAPDKISAILSSVPSEEFGIQPPLAWPEPGVVGR